jgi:hypothetical protein
MTKKNLFDTSKLQDVQWGNIELPGLSDDKLHSTSWNHSRKNNKKYLESMAKLHSNKDYKEARNKAYRQSLENDTQRGLKISQAKQTLNQDQVDIIWHECWTASRGTDLYKRLAKENNIGFCTIQKIALGKYWLKNVPKAELDKLKKEWKAKYGDVRAQRISESKKGHTVSKETRSKISNTLKNKK